MKQKNKSKSVNLETTGLNCKVAKQYSCTAVQCTLYKGWENPSGLS